LKFKKILIFGKIKTLLSRFANLRRNSEAGEPYVKLNEALLLNVGGVD